MTPSAPKVPLQARATKTRQTVLDAALAILGEQGLEALNTNAIADRAEVRIATVYRYFRNKHDVLTALAEQHLSALESWEAGFKALADRTEAAETLGPQLVAGYFETLKQQPAIIELRSAMRAIPALRALDEASLERWTQHLAEALKRRGTAASPAQVNTAARVLVEAICNGADRTLSCSTREQRRRLEALGALANAALAQLQ